MSNVHNKINKYRSNKNKVVVIGGGTGLSTMLRGLKQFTEEITAIVTVADDGGGSGMLRKDLGIIPPGDIRNCILALADMEPVMEKLLRYRFTEGMLKGQSFGNLFLAAMVGITESFEEAVRKTSDVLAVTGKVLPVTLDDVELCAELEDGYVVHGESNITNHNFVHKGKINRVFLKPEKTTPVKGALESIMEADAIVLGPGSLYTSIIPNLLVDGIAEYIKKTEAVKIYVCNVMTQPGETDGYSVLQHIKAIEDHSFESIVDHCLINTADIACSVMEKYVHDGAQPVAIDECFSQKTCMRLHKGQFSSTAGGFIRHDPVKLAKGIIDIISIS